MLRKCLPLAFLVILCALVSSPITQAASQFFGYDLRWQNNRSLLLRNATGKLLARLTVGRHITIHHGSTVLTLSLRPLARSAPELPTDALAQQLLAVINRDRTAHQAPPLTIDPRESWCSLQHSRHMAAQGYISHDQFPTDVCIRHTQSAENVGVAGGTPLDVILELHRSMMAEGPCPHTSCTAPQFEAHGHYLNLINPIYRHVGIGIFTQGDTTWLTEDFTN